jgi:hypothetical protein
MMNTGATVENCIVTKVTMPSSERDVSIYSARYVFYIE